MYLKQRIIELIKSKNTRITANLDRDIEIVLTYFGLGNLRYPTLQSTADQYDIKTRQRVEQIIEKKFSTKVNELDVVLQIEEIIQSNELHFMSDLNTELIRRDIIVDKVSVKGLLNLLQSFGMCKNYDIYNFDINIASRKDIENDEDILIITGEKSRELKTEVLKVKMYPGQHGICNLNEIFELGKVRSVDFETMKRIILLLPDSWLRRDEDGMFWYLFENRDNVIINALGKLVNVTSNVDIAKLSNIIFRLLQQRTLPLNLPSERIISSYLASSKFTSIREQYVVINLDPAELLNIEKDIWDYYKSEKVDYFTYNQLKVFLAPIGYSEGFIRKSLYHSPIIYLDGVPRNYELVIANRFSSEDVKYSGSINDYDLYRERLKNLYSLTNQSIENKISREQSILKEWLFKGKTHLTCALCGRTYSVKSLVTAHKKKRSLCSENERIDPYIVMPLCLFGCDYLYENRFIRIRAGKLEAVISENMTEAEKEYIRTFDGRNVAEEWLKGNPDYFA